MYNVNSPIIEEMLRNTPSGGMGNIPYVPRNLQVETVTQPSPEYLESIKSIPIHTDTVTVPIVNGNPVTSNPNLINVSPYPTPYDMVTGIGMQNQGYPNLGNPIPMNYSYQYGNMIPMSQTLYQQPMSQMIFNDQGQPVNSTPTPNRGVVLPIPNYYNPYMGVGQAFGNAPVYNPATGFYIPRNDQLTHEDISARNEGFANAAEKMVNDFKIHKMLCIAAYRGAGSSDEEINKMIERKNKEMSKKIDDFDENSNKRRSSTSFFGYSGTNIKTIKLRIRTEDEIIGESEPGKPLYINPNIAQTIQSGIEMKQRFDEIKYQQQAYMHAHAVERELDKMDSIGFFNTGINLVHHRDKELLWDYLNKSTKLYDSDRFMQRLIAEDGTPQAQARYYREKARKNRRIKELREDDEKKGLIRLPNGLLVDPKNGRIVMSVPEEILANHEDSIFKNSTERDRRHRKRLETDVDYKVDDFAERYVDKPIRDGTLPGMQRFGNYGSQSTILGPMGTNYDEHYLRAKENFLRAAYSI